MLELANSVLFPCLESVADYPHQWQTDFRALQPGDNQFLLQETVASALAIRVGTFSGPSVHRGEVPRGARTFSILMNDASGHFFRGKRVQRYDIMPFGSNLEVDTASGSSSSICSISVAQDFLDEFLGRWGVEVDLDSNRVVPLGKQLRLEFEQAINTLTRLAGDSRPSSQAQSLVQQECLVGILLGAFANEASMPATERKDYRTVHRALEYIEQNLPHPIRLSRLSSELGVTPRTLQLQFKRHLHATPKQAIEHMRLSLFRKNLIAEADARATISRLAAEHGYDHLSKLSQDYFKAFGELPSQTLRAHSE